MFLGDPGFFLKRQLGYLNMTAGFSNSDLRAKNNH